MLELLPATTRREFLRQSDCGLGSLALSAMLCDEHQASAAATPALPQPHLSPRAKRVIFLFMHGGPTSAGG